MTMSKPATPAQRVAASRARAIDAGARPTPRGMLPPDAARALDALMASGYAASATACIALALIEAAKAPPPPARA